MNLKNCFKSLTIGLTSASLVVGCSPNTKASVPQVSAGFKMTGSSSAATVAKNSPKNFWGLLLNQAYAFVPASLVDSTGLSISLSQAWTVIKEIEFKSDENQGLEDSEIEVEFKGPYVVDLLSNTPLVLDTQLISEKAIRRIKMKLHKAETIPASAPAGLVNNSIYIVGTVGTNNFTFQLDDSTEIQIAGPKSFLPSENSELLVQIQLANIFKQINMSSIINNEVISAANRHAGSNLCPAIDASANDIYTCMRKGLETRANFGKDEDGDDDLDSNDSTVE